MKNILLLTHDDAGQEARFQAAVDLCRTLDGHITCVDVTWTPPLAGNGFYDNAYAAIDVLTDEKTREAANKQALERRLAHEDVSWNWIDVAGDFAHCLKSAADLADIIVVTGGLDASAVFGMREAASDLIVRSGKPVLAVPVGSRRLDLESALVAWDGSPRAANALRAAVPLLRHAKRIDLVEVEDGSIATPAEDAASYLSRHDVSATIRRIVPQGDAGDTLLREVMRGDFGYAVMGGFGHLRFVEALFGGVTRTMLNRSPIPVFFAH